MSEDAAQQEEPSIEEILGSIRRIISEDDEPEEEVAAEEEAPAQEAAPEPEPEPAPAPEPEPVEAAAEEEDVLELTQKIEEDGNVAETEEEPVEEVKIDMLDDAPEPVVEDLPPLGADENLVSDGAADVTAAVMAKLARSAAVTRKSEGISIEDVVRELVKPMLRQWLDDNLPDIVEQMVERELERIARRAE